MIDEAYTWICKQRIDYSENNDIWDMRRNWNILKHDILNQLNDGSYMFSPLQRFDFPDEIVSMWSSRDMIVLKLITGVLHGVMKDHLPQSCCHVKGHGGIKKAVKRTYEALPEHTYFFRSDIKQYYESIRFDVLMGIVDHYVKQPTLATLVLKAIRRTETFGGNFYDFYQKGLAKRCPLSPLLAAIALMPLDHAMDGIKDIFYTRFVDDWIVLTKSRTMLRKIIKKTHNILNTLHLTMHPNKTYIGKIQKGFNFLGYFYQPSRLLPSLESIRRVHERSAVRYAQVSRRRHVSKPSRDISDYQVNERAPTDEDITRVLCSLSWQIHQNPERQTHLQRYLQRWGWWFKNGLTEIDAFMTCVQVTLPSLGMIMDKHDITSIILAQLN